MEIRDFVLEHILQEERNYRRRFSKKRIAAIADAWLETSGNRSGSLFRLDVIRMIYPEAHRILDMGAGCGTFVLFALRQGYDVFGIEPESWKLEVLRQQVYRLGYDPSWVQHIIAGYGESLPFTNDSFDCVSTFQTIEHVRDVEGCCREMLRVVRCGGCICLRCPDYRRSTYEGHYGLPWLPGLWGKWAERYLTLCRRPLAGIKLLTPVSRGMLVRTFRNIAHDTGYTLRIVNIDYLRALKKLHLPTGLPGYIATLPLFAAHFLRLLFRADFAVHLAVYVDKK